MAKKIIFITFALFGIVSFQNIAISAENDTTVDTLIADYTNNARITDIMADVTEAWHRAGTSYDTIGEDPAIAFAAECFSDLVDSICSVWDCSGCSE